jgi:molybdenum ABC transporter molybdate-binding protein
MGYSALRLVVFAALILFAPVAAVAQTPGGVTLFAAGSLKAALTAVTQAFTAQTGIAVTPTYGSSGLLRARIESGAPVDLFASADVESPQRLHAEGKSGDVTVFAHNHMCLLVKSSIPATRSVADIMLDPAVRLITSTPKADPAGDYAEAIFAKIDATRPAR